MALLSHNNWIATGSLLVPLGAVSYRDNLKLWQTPQPAASIVPGGGLIEIRAAFADAPVRVTALLAHNLRSSAQIRFEYRRNGQTLMTAQEDYLVEGGAYLVDGQPYTVRGEAPTEPVGSRMIICQALAEATTCDELRVHISNAGGGTVRIGHIWAGDAIEIDMLAGWPIQTADYGRIEEVGGTAWAARSNRAQGVAATFARLSEDQAIGTSGGANLRDIFREVGSTRPVLLLPRIQSQAQIDRTVIWGRPSAPGRVQHERGPNWRAELDLVGLPVG